MFSRKCDLPKISSALPQIDSADGIFDKVVFAKLLAVTHDA